MGRDDEDNDQRTQQPTKQLASQGGNGIECTYLSMNAREHKVESGLKIQTSMCTPFEMVQMLTRILRILVWKEGEEEQEEHEEN
jgi:hypothetical protein